MGLFSSLEALPVRRIAAGRIDSGQAPSAVDLRQGAPPVPRQADPDQVMEVPMETSAHRLRELPDSFRAVRLRLAREPKHPEGDPQHGYDILVPLQEDGRIDPRTYRAHSQACRVRRFRPDEEDRIGRLEHGPGGAWLIRYGDTDPEVGFHFRDERFVPGEYVSIREDVDRTHTYQVWEVRRP
jgi:hypothetical protein